MSGMVWRNGLVSGLLVATMALAGDPDCDCPEIVLVQGKEGKEPAKKGDPGKEIPKGKEPPKKMDPEFPDIFAQATNTAGEAPESSFTRMMGDWIGLQYALQRIQVPGARVQTTYPTQTQITTIRIPPNNGTPPDLRVRVPTTVLLPPVTTITPTVETVTARVPVLTRGSFKIAENERPLPETRLIMNFNHYSGVSGPLYGPIPEATSLTNGIPSSTRTFLPATLQDRYVNRGVLGFEAAFLDNTASIGMRAPFVQQQGDGSLTDGDFGDLSFIFKYLALTNGVDGLSGGVVITAPTGPAIQTIAGPIRSTLIQPWVGFYVTAGDAFAMGFSSIAFPTDDRDTTLMFNSLGVGLMLYQSPGEFLTYVAPMAEVHVTTPLSSQGPDSLLYVPDLVVLTGGIQFGFGPVSLTLGVAQPVTGPRLYDFEAFGLLNFRF